MLTSQLDITVGAEDEDGGVTCVSRQMEKQLQTGRVRPVQIVEQQGDRPRLGNRLQKARDCPEHTLLIVLRPDRQDYEGTSVTVTVARKLRVPRMLLVVNKTPDVFDSNEVRQRVEQAYDCEVAAVMPHSDELMVLSSEGIFALRYPDHPLTALYLQVANRLIV